MAERALSKIASRRRRSAGCVVAAVLLLCSQGRAQDVMESSLKAAFIYNFAKFTEWPPDVLPATGSFTACVLGDTPLREALERTVKGRQFSGRAVVVSEVQLDGKLRSCHLLYVSGVTAARTTAIVVALGNAPVLTISDLDDFTQLGGIVQLFVESGQMRFDLNLAAARRGRLVLSSKLIVLAAHVRDNPKGAEP
jgi:hypothetical protein